MKVTKHEHSCLQLTIADEHLIIDPGMFLTPFDFVGVVGVVITHDHADHWTPEQLARIIEASPDATIYAPADVAAAAKDFTITVVKDGDEAELGPFSLKFFGKEHNAIHESVPVPENVGVLVNDELYYPGDSYTVPPVPVPTLAAPLGAPWLKIGEVMDFILAVKPQRAFYAHDMTLSVAGKKMHVNRLTWATEKNGGEFHVLEVGESLDL
ncbi:MAG TPA: MBL fold metallo-hydrolase [Pseudolysinimonas sp.]|nr:MBL fold metallo-hydrolase [Pseudolysinimonas sp.]